MPSASSRTAPSPATGSSTAGLEWSVASSGWKSAWRTPTWEAMLDRGPGRRLRRPRRRLRQPLPAQPQADPHRGRGSPASRPAWSILFADERLLSSDPEQLGPVRPGGPRGRGVQPQALASGSVKATRPSVGASGCRAATGPPTASSGRASPRRCGSTRRRQRRSVAPTSSPPLAHDRLGGRAASRPCEDPRRRAAHEPDLRRPSPHRRARRRARPSSSLPSGPRCSRCASCAEPGRPGRIVKRNYPLRLRCSGCGRFLYGDTGALPPSGPDLRGVHRGDARLLRRRYAEQPRQARPGPLLPAELVRGRHRHAPRAGGSGRRRRDHGGRAPVPRSPEPRVDELTLARIEPRARGGRRAASPSPGTCWPGSGTWPGSTRRSRLARSQSRRARLTSAEVVGLPALTACALGGRGSRRAPGPRHGPVRAHWTC